MRDCGGVIARDGTSEGMSAVALMLAWGDPGALGMTESKHLDGASFSWEVPGSPASEVYTPDLGLGPDASPEDTSPPSSVDVELEPEPRRRVRRKPLLAGCRAPLGWQGLLHACRLSEAIRAAPARRDSTAGCLKFMIPQRGMFRSDMGCGSNPPDVQRGLI